MSIDRRLLSIIGRRLPAIYDVIPRGPQMRFASRFSEVALNPQPLPPHELGAATPWSSSIPPGSPRFGLDTGPRQRSRGLVPPAPKKLKLPPWWPPIPDPDPHPDWFIDFHLGFAVRLALASAEVEGTRLGEVLGQALERSIAAISPSTSVSTTPAKAELAVLAAPLACIDLATASASSPLPVTLLSCAVSPCLFAPLRP